MTKQSEYLYDRLREENRKLEQEILEMHSDRSSVLVAKIILAMLCFSGGDCAGVWYAIH